MKQPEVIYKDNAYCMSGIKREDGTFMPSSIEVTLIDLHGEVVYPNIRYTMKNELVASFPPLKMDSENATAWRKGVEAAGNFISEANKRLSQCVSSALAVGRYI